MWTFRYSSEGKSRSLFFTKDVRTLRSLYPERQILREVSANARLVVSEPMGDLARRLERGARVQLQRSWRRGRTPAALHGQAADARLH
jgi:hypothetical protein